MQEKNVRQSVRNSRMRRATYEPVASNRRRAQLAVMAVMPTSEQIRAARAMLGWSVTELARRATVSWRTVQTAEAAGGSVPRMNIATVEKITAALEAGGIEFLQASHGGGPGIRRR